MNRKRENTKNTAIEEHFFNNILQLERVYKLFFLPFSGGGYKLWKLLEINSRQTHKTPVSSMGA